MSGSGWIRKRVQGGSRGARGAYAALRRAMGLRTYMQRSREARRLGRDPAFRIDREVGYKVFAPGELDGVAELVEAIGQLVAERSKDPLPPSGRKGFLQTNLLDAERLDRDSVFLRFALRDDFLAAISEYLGVVPLLKAIEVWRSVHVGDAPRSSQLFHCDAADTTQVKIFVHGSDVDDAAGPLTIIDAAHSRELTKRIGYSCHSRVSDEEAQRWVGSAHVRALTGPAGAVALVDTSRCFHFGSRLEPGAPPRILCVFQYVTPFSFNLPRDHRKGAPFRHLGTPDRTDAANLLLGAV